MKSILRWTIFGVSAGLFVLTSPGQTKNDAAVAPATKPHTMMYRFYEGTDGLSHVEKIAVHYDKVQGNSPIASLLELAGKGAEIHVQHPSPPGTFNAFHPAERRQYIFCLTGRITIEFSGGGKITMNPGDIALAEDTAPSKGHRNLVWGPEDRVSVWIPLADQTVVRGSILNGDSRP